MGCKVLDSEYYEALSREGFHFIRPEDSPEFTPISENIGDNSGRLANVALPSVPSPEQNGEPVEPEVSGVVST